MFLVFCPIVFWSHFVFGKKNIGNWLAKSCYFSKKSLVFSKIFFVDHSDFENFVNKNAIKTLLLRVFGFSRF